MKVAKDPPMTRGACAWKNVEGVPFYTWKAAAPTLAELEAAPLFTIFPGAKAVKGELEQAEVVHMEGGDDDLWFISEISGSFRFETMEPQVFPLLEKAGVMPPQKLYYQPQLNGDLQGETLSFRGRPIKLGDDTEIVPYAIEAGWSIIKAPDAMIGKASKYCDFYVLDVLHESKKRVYFTQTPLRSHLTHFASMAKNG